jgi:outer membrane protein
MKKILTTLAITATLASTLSADFVRTEIGIGGWSQTPSGVATENIAGSNGSNVFDEKEDTSFYAWLLIKHPIPILPNIRLEYANINANGVANGSWGGINFASSPSSLKLKEYDVIPYYNLLDNTFWLTLDLGLDLKYIKYDYTVDGTPAVGIIPAVDAYQDSSSFVIPLLYLRARVQIPATGLGIESDIKYVAYNGSTIYDFRAKVDYTFDITPVFQPGIELGYRAQKIKIEDSSADLHSDVDFTGVYAGVVIRF